MQKTGFVYIKILLSFVCALFALFHLTITCSPAQTVSQVTQTFTLHPGWNAIFLHVQPETESPDILFSNIDALESVWTWVGNNSTVEFIQNPGEGFWNKPGWCVYLTAPDKAFINNLHAILGGYPYLIKLTGDKEVAFQVSGMPSVQKIRWIPNSFNLVGFRVDPNNPPNFSNFFAGSQAHTGQAIYQLDNATGEWKFIDRPSAVDINSNEAYWVYCEGISDYQGPLEIQLPLLDGLNFGAFLDRLTITLHNLSDKTLTVGIVPLPGEIDLTYRTFNKETGAFEWPPLAEMPPVSLEGGRYQNVWISVHRETLQSEQADSLVRISDNFGTLMLVPVHVEKEVSP